MSLHPDIRDFLSVLEAESAEYLIIGGYAVAFHARPRFTKIPTRSNTSSQARSSRRYSVQPDRVYKSAAWDRWRAENETARTIPPMIFVVFSHAPPGGEKPRGGNGTNLGPFPALAPAFFRCYSFPR